MDYFWRFVLALILIGVALQVLDVMQFQDFFALLLSPFDNK